MVARKLSSYDVATSLESYSKRPSVYIDPDSDIFEGLQYLQNIDRQNCINCLQLWRTSAAGLEGITTRKLISDSCLYLVDKFHTFPLPEPGNVFFFYFLDSSKFAILIFQLKQHKFHETLLAAKKKSDPARRINQP